MIKDITAYYTARGDLNATSIDQITNGTTGAGWSLTTGSYAANAVTQNFTLGFKDNNTLCLHMDINASATGAGIIVVQDTNSTTTTTLCTGVNKLVKAQTFNLGGVSIK